MRIESFKLERYFAQHEFTAPYLLSSSDCEPLTMAELLGLADKQTTDLWQNLKLGYTESEGNPLLKKEIAKLYALLDEENILVLAPQEGIFIAMNVFLEQGDMIVAPYPAYQSLYSIAASLRCEIASWPPHRETAEWRFRVDDLAPLLQCRPKLLVMNFPHNPTGALISKEELEEIVGLARKYDVAIFSDEMYRFLEYDEGNLLPSVSDLDSESVSLCGMSKSFALAGLRIGWLATRNKDFLLRALYLKDYTTICASAPSEILALIGLRARGQILARNLNMIHRNKAILRVFFRSYPKHFVWREPQGGSVSFIELEGLESVDVFCEKLIKKKGVLLVPASAVDCTGNFFRVGLGRKDVESALEKVAEFLKEEYGL